MKNADSKHSWRPDPRASLPWTTGSFIKVRQPLARSEAVRQLIETGLAKKAKP